MAGGRVLRGKRERFIKDTSTVRDTVVKALQRKGAAKQLGILKFYNIMLIYTISYGESLIDHQELGGVSVPRYTATCLTHSPSS